MKNLNIYFLLKHQLFITIISISLWIYLLGPDFIHPTNQEWLNSGDLSTYQLGWKYFSTDIWRFPISLNPNYGIYVGGSLVFSDSIPSFNNASRELVSSVPNQSGSWGVTENLGAGDGK